MDAPSPQGQHAHVLWRTELDVWVSALRSAGRTRSTIRTRTEHLQMLARWSKTRGPWELSTSDLQMWLGSKPIATSTLRNRRDSLRSFYRWAHGAGRIDTDPALTLESPRPREAFRPPIPDDLLFEAWDRADERERLILSLAAELGLRRGEIAVIHRRDLYRDAYGWVLRVHGKGQQIRNLPLPPGLARRLLEITTLNGGWAFPGDFDGHLSPRWIGTLISRLLPPGVTMHQIRHRFAVVLYRETHDVRLVQLLLGHTSLATTQAYLDRHATDLRGPVIAANSHLRANAYAYHRHDSEPLW